jgi:hypothetical protein
MKRSNAAEKENEPMMLVLTEKCCRECKARLTEFEVKEKEGLCLECFKEGAENNDKRS